MTTDPTSGQGPAASAASPAQTPATTTASAGSATSGSGTSNSGSSRATATATGPSFASTGSQYYTVLVSLLATFFLISNIAATKQMDFGGWIVDGGVFLFPLTYLLGSIISEVYGFRAAFRAVLVGFIVMVVGAVVFGLVTISPAASDSHNQEAFEILFGWDGMYVRILIASLVAYLAGQMMNALVITRIKRRFGESHLWARIAGSTVCGQLLDTALFGLVAFTALFGQAALMDTSQLLSYIFLGVLYKCAVEWVLIPVTYAVVGMLKRREPTYQR